MCIWGNGVESVKAYVTIGGTASSSTGGGGISIKSEPMGAIRGGYRNNRGRGRGQAQGRGSYRGGITTKDQGVSTATNPDSPETT